MRWWIVYWKHLRHLPVALRDDRPGPVPTERELHGDLGSPDTDRPTEPNANTDANAHPHSDADAATDTHADS
jgi:hypothetical protein